MRDDATSPNTLSLGFVEELYAAYVRSPDSVPEDWRRYFEEMDGGERFSESPQIGPSFTPRSVFDPVPKTNGNGRPALVSAMVALQDRVDQLIRAYRVRGHLVAKIDPLGLPRTPQPELDPRFYGFTEEDEDRVFSTNTIRGARNLTLRQILDRLRQTYCRSIGVQFMHIDNLSVKNWLTDRMEGTENHLILTRDEQLQILARLSEAVIFEEFVRKKFLGAKSFSLEGGESLIPLLDLAIEKAGEQGVEEIVIGMAHRGRLNVLRNILRKGPREIFREFDDPDPERNLGQGDVKYHKGYQADWTTANGHGVHLSLCFNPSHLEFVNTVVLGRVRAKQDRLGDRDRERALGILIHGDAAFAGEGVVQETLNLSELPAYRTGGTVHVIVNNQIGFTTGPEEGRSTTYATDVAKMLQIPIFHVNGEDPEAVAQVVRLAMDFRHTFRRDVVIDMYCYRRLGHNEGDEPAFTQPLLYRAIKNRKSTRQGYLEHLLKMGEVTREDADRIVEELRKLLEKELEAARSEDYSYPVEEPSERWRDYHGGPESGAHEVETGVDRARLSDLLERTTVIPEDFEPHKKIRRWLDQRVEMAEGKRPLDWSAAEALAFASLATEGHRVRLTGQDSARGTFSHRHALLTDVNDGRRFMPLMFLDPGQERVEIANSPLSEIGVLGFEYGYSLDSPRSLVMWEAQFGDFANCAQVIIDQFLVSGEDKWKRFSGLVMLLPHSFEGMGPEHSSARLERYLQSAAEDNIQVVNLTTPAQYFHCLRRQVLRRWRKPLIVMSPKSLLRHPVAASSLEELAAGRFHRILADIRKGHEEETRRILLCSGKLYYELERRRKESGRDDVAILRLEQYYPLPEREVLKALAPYPDGTPVVWVQEEPENMGAWRFLKNRFGERIGGRHSFHGIHRAESASPATGSASSHQREQEMLIATAFAG